MKRRANKTTLNATGNFCEAWSASLNWAIVDGVYN